MSKYKTCKAKCQYCGDTFLYSKHSSQGKYCSNKCQGMKRSEERTKRNVKLLKEGRLKDNNRLAIKKALIAYGREQECSICGIVDWQGKPLPFILDHIDGNANNNVIENLRLVCSNCDSQLDTYKKKNKQGRNTRKL